MNKITVEDIESIVGFELSSYCKSLVNKLDLTYETLSQEKRDQAVIKMINTLNEDLEVAGKHRLEKWENGWDENLDLLVNKKDIDTLVPKYFGKYDVARWKGNFIKNNSKHFDYHQLIVLVDSILHEYVGTKYNNLFEFGCGPAYHLLRFSNFNPNINLVGLDWTVASQNIIKKINELGINNKISGYNFNFFEPNYQINIPESSAIFTCNALEQVGENYKEFINFILDKKPDLCINFEPMPEFLDKDNLIDYLCILYMEKRKYLKGYLSYLQQLEKENKIEILLTKRLPGGSYFIEGYPVVIWKPKK
jgi:hypothetical protein